jgi:hypothetical protein
MRVSVGEVVPFKDMLAITLVMDGLLLYCGRLEGAGVEAIRLAGGASTWTSLFIEDEAVLDGFEYG